jgi:DNA-binding response OmpR family regulator
MYALLVTEDADEAAVLSLVLQRAGLAVATAYGLERAMLNWPERPADLILVALPGPDFLAQVRYIRAETEVPLGIVVGSIEEDVHYALLEAGADLVIPRPFSARLLMAQVRALLRRAGSVPMFSLPTLNVAGLTLDPATRTVQIARQPPHRLTHLEFRLLYTLMIHRGQVLPTDTIVERVWGYSSRGDRDLVRGLISRLRSKVEADPRHPRYILTIPGVGYSFREDDE